MNPLLATCCLLPFAPERRTVFAVPRHVEDRSHLRPTFEALAHAHLDAAIVVTHGQPVRGARAGRTGGRACWVIEGAVMGDVANRLTACRAALAQHGTRNMDKSVSMGYY